MDELVEMMMSEIADMSKETIHRRVSSRDMCKYTAQHKQFSNHECSCYGRHILTGYAVYSYGEHFPIYFWDKETNSWFGNSGKHSRSTTRHQTDAYPAGVPREEMTWVKKSDLNTIILDGAIGAVATRISK